MIDPFDIHARLVSLGDKWADADSAANLLEETKKSVLAQIMCGITAGSNAEREMRALATEDYQRHLQAMVRAREVANHAKVAYDAAKMYCELARTVEATKRAEMRL